MNIRTINTKWYLLSLPFCRRECLSVPERSVHTYVFRRVMALPGMLFYREREMNKGRTDTIDNLIFSGTKSPAHCCIRSLLINILVSSLLHCPFVKQFCFNKKNEQHECHESKSTNISFKTDLITADVYAG